jgi:hypothetical protein
MWESNPQLPQPTKKPNCGNHITFSKCLNFLQSFPQHFLLTILLSLVDFRDELHNMIHREHRRLVAPLPGAPLPHLRLEWTMWNGIKHMVSMRLMPFHSLCSSHYYEPSSPQQPPLTETKYFSPSHLC